MSPDENLLPLAGGFSGETYVSGTGDDRVVVRIYGGRSAARGPAAVDVDAALLRLMRGVVPVPEVLEIRRPVGDLPALLVAEFLPGERGDLVLPGLDATARAMVGAHLGRLLDRLTHVPTLTAGRFVDGDLRIEPFPRADDGLPGWVESHLSALTNWSHDERAGLVALADRAQDLLDTVDRTCLVHSDLNPKNVLLDPETLEVTGLLDWEFAHSGSPYTDLGNLLRFERDEAFTSGVLGGLDKLDQRGQLELARSADLFALVELASRRDDNPVAARADALLRAKSQLRDLDV